MQSSSHLPLHSWAADVMMGAGAATLGPELDPHVECGGVAR